MWRQSYAKPSRQLAAVRPRLEALFAIGWELAM
jgi:hypothetical protein